eukprot:TRINITY_DN23045_c0_g1_i1.p1 TRINITY_DN23045_c0_g1~~TRINITY_DN23045_c0_g1_i1.p1  ORF type:complete len:105 (-),score=1.23 TRINITY_DN23045_c0_g1_i1:35-349(-)
MTIKTIHDRVRCLLKVSYVFSLVAMFQLPSLVKARFVLPTQIEQHHMGRLPLRTYIEDGRQTFAGYSCWRAIWERQGAREGGSYRLALVAYTGYKAVMQTSYSE